MVKRCVSCHQQESRFDGRSLHRFPADKNLQKTWITLLNRLDLNDVTNHRVCSNHFDSSSFIVTPNNKQNGVIVRNSKRLKRGALPVNLTISTQPTCLSRSVATQTDLISDDLCSLFEKLSFFEQKTFATTLCIERFLHDDININYYTGFRSYVIFTLVYELLEVNYSFFSSFLFAETMTIKIFFDFRTTLAKCTPLCKVI